MNTNHETLHELLNAAEVGDTFAEIPQKPETERQLNELAKLRIDGTHDYDREAQFIVKE